MTQAPRSWWLTHALAVLLVIAMAMIVVGFVARQRLTETWAADRADLVTRITLLSLEKEAYGRQLDQRVACPVCPTCPQVTALVTPRPARPSLAEIEREYRLGHLDCRTLSGPRLRGNTRGDPDP